jgi:hypothetical protein
MQQRSIVTQELWYTTGPMIPGHDEIGKAQQRKFAKVLLKYFTHERIP